MFYRQTSQNSWIAVPTHGSPPSRAGHCAVVWNNAMYIFGGESSVGNECYNTVHRFDLITYRWELLECKGDVPSKRTKVTAVLYNDCMYVLGGFKSWSDNESINFHNFLKLNLKSLKWYILPYLPHKKYSAVVWNDQIIACADDKKKIFVFDLINNKWKNVEAFGNPIPGN